MWPRGEGRGEGEYHAAPPVPPRLRLAWVLDTLDGSAGGVVSARRVIAALAERHDVTVLAAGTGAPPEPGRVDLPAFHVPLAARLTRENGFVFAVPRRRVLEEAFRAADVVHVQFPFWLGLRAVALARAMGKPVVAAFHVQPENVLLNLGLRSDRLAEAAYRFLLSRYFERADAVVCPSPFALEALRTRGLTRPAEVITNGVPPGLVPAPPGADERPERHRGRLLVAVVGRLAREKRVDVAIEGVRRSRHAHRIQLVITGRGPRAEEVRRRAEGLPVPAEVGFLPEGDLRRLLRTADLALHASEVELEGMAVLEALACGTPTLLARAPASAARQFALSDDWLFAPGDPADLARKLDALVDAPGALATARAACLARAAAYRLDDAVARLSALYARVAPGGDLDPTGRARRPPPGAPARAATAPPAGR